MITSTWRRSFCSWIRRQSSTRPHSPRPGSRGTQRMIPPISASAVTRCTRLKPRFASTIAHSRPAGPAPTTSTSFAAFAAGSNRSGCQPRRYSSPAVAFCVQPRWPCESPFTMHWLQPMHSRISSRRPSSILRGRNGSAIDGRAAPITSQTPERIDLGHLVGVREPPDADDRLSVARRTWPVHSSCQPAWKKRDTPESSDHSEIEPMLTSHRWTWRSASRMNSSPSSSGMPASAPPASTAIRTAIAQSRRRRRPASPAARPRIGRGSSSDPPYSSLRRL